MLTLNLRQEDTAGPWTFNGRSYISDSTALSYVRPYDHPALEHFQISDGARTLLVVRDRNGSQPSREGIPQPVSPRLYDEIAQEARAWSLEFVTIEFASGVAAFQAGALGTVPLYLTVRQDETLYGSWDFTAVSESAADVLLDPVEIVRSLTYWDRYSHNTLIRGVRQLTERSRAEFGVNGLSMTYPEPAKHSSPRELQSGADPIDGFDLVLSTLINRHYFDPASTAVELSGGMDSAAIAVTLAELCPSLVTAGGMHVPGPSGKQQVSRRNEMISVLGLRQDISIAALDWPPLHPSGPRATRSPFRTKVSPHESTFIEAQGEFFRAMAASGIKYVFSGIGGDEMLSLRPGEADRPLNWERKHPQWLTSQAIEALEAAEDDIAPSSMVSEVTLMSLASIAPLYIRNGLWPVMPLADPTLITYCEWLPLNWRQGKFLLRARLRRRGLSEEVARPALPENLADVMSAGLQHWGLEALEELVAESRLADLGLVDPDLLRAACKSTREAGAVQETDHPLFHVISMEQYLRGV